MLWLSVLTNESLLLFAETLLIITGSMLLGILLSYLYTGGIKSKLAEAQGLLETEHKQASELREQIVELSQIRADLQAQIDQLERKTAEQSKTIYDQQVYLQSREQAYQQYKTDIDNLQATIDAYQHRLEILREELEQTKAEAPRVRKSSATQKVSVNFEHVSALLGKQVTENDLTLITGIGAKTAALLQSHGIETWEKLAATPLDQLLTILQEAGGIYKTHDPAHWGRQAQMAADGEWRKLRVYQEALRKKESPE